MHRPPIAFALAGVSLLARPPHAAIAIVAAEGSGTLTLPLLGHHHVIERLRRELRAAGEHGDVDVRDLDYDRLLHPRRRVEDGATNLRQRRLSQQQLGALYQGYGTHYVDVWVGYPPQRQTAVIDTGSSVTVFPCSGCAGCGRHADERFDEDKSESFRATHCPMSREEDGCLFGKCDAGVCVVDHNFGAAGDVGEVSGWTAFEASDVAYAGGPHDRPVDGGAATPAIDPRVDELSPVHAAEFAFALTFGCQTSVSGYFEKQLASGVVGLDRRAQSFWGQMRTAQVIKKAQFSLCFVKQPIASVSGSTAGAVTLGGVDGRLHKTPMVFARSVGDGNTASFKVQMRKMYLRRGNDQSVMSSNKSKYHLLEVSEELLNGKQMYNIDSGTTDTYLIQSLSDEFRKIWKDVTGMEYSNDPIAFDSDSDILKFPTVVLQMVPHNGGIGDEVRTGDPREIPGLAGNVDVTLPNDVMVAVPPKHYMQRNYKDKTFTSRIYLDRDNALGNVLGANAMMGHDILFDMDGARIGFAESDCDYARLVAASARGELAEDSAIDDVAVGQPSPAAAKEDDGGYQLCKSSKCRGFFGLTLLAFFVFFCLFARRYVAKRGSERVPVRVGASEYEMKSSTRNAHAGRSSPYTDGDEWNEIEESNSDLPVGVGGAYYDEKPSHSYSDQYRPSGRRSPGRMDRSNGREGERERRGRVKGNRYRDREGGRRSEHQSSSRDSVDGNHRSSHSLQSGRSHRSKDSHHSRGSQGSSGSGSSGGSRETKRSSRSHRSTRSRESHRSHKSHQSNRSSRHSSGSRERRHHGDRGDQQHHSGTRYRDDYDDIPMPPSIS